MRLNRRAFVVSALLSAAGASPQTLSEARVKAKLALTLARFAQWPSTAFASPNQPLLLCAAHRDDTLATAFSELAGQTVAGHQIKLLQTLTPAGIGCHVLFVHESAERAGAAALAAVAGQPVLTIGDSQGFSVNGGMVELVNVNDAMRLDVNLRVIRAAQLDLSSRVLQLARQVRE